MLAAVIGWSVRHRFWVLGLTGVLALGGVRAFASLPIDAVPDLTNVQVQVLTSAPSLGPLDVERLITVPVELALGGLPRAQQVRSTTRYGGSAVTVVFEDGVDPLFARQQVAERLGRAQAAVPAAYGVPELGPMSTGLGEIYQFEVRAAHLDAMQRREILDWQVAPRLRAVPGVVEVNVFGGELKTYEVALDPDRLVAAGVAFGTVFEALARNNQSVGGGVIERGPAGLLVRGDALVAGIDDLGAIAVGERDGVPILLRELGAVALAPMLRQGAASRDGRGEIVAGMAMMQEGQNARAVARALAATVAEVNRQLPPGVAVAPFYDRTALVEQTLATVAHSLAIGGALVVLVLLAMLRNLRAGLLAAATIPLAMAAAFIGMRATGTSGNLMSLGAIDFGLVVDGAIILLENVVHRLSQHARTHPRPPTAAERDRLVQEAALEVRGATAFGELIIALVYLPVLALDGVAGRMFQPMAMTVLFALGGAFVLSLTFVPAGAAWLLTAAAPRRAVAPPPAATLRVEPLLRACIGRPWRTLAAAGAVAAAGIAAAAALGSEFVPRLDEGALVVEVTRPAGTSLSESVRQSGAMERVLLALPEVQGVVSKSGRPAIGNDLMGVEQSDVYVFLRPRAEWPTASSVAALVGRTDAALRAAVPGQALSFSQPIEMRMNELLSGVRSDFAVQVVGDDLAELARLGDAVARVLAAVPGAADVRADRVRGLPVLTARVDREALARLGVPATAALDAIEAVGGRAVGTVFDGQRRFALRARLTAAARACPEALARLPVAVPGRPPVRLGDVATLATVDEPVTLGREAGQRRLWVQANVRGRDLGSFAAAAQARIGREVALPAGYRLAWSGQFEHLQAARARLAVVVPLTLAAITALLYATFAAWRPVGMILATVPLAASGGALALRARGLPLSMSAAVGFIALAGVAVLNGLVLVSEIRRHHAAGLDPAAAALAGALRRLRPVLTTALVAALGFVPMALARGAGAEVQRPLATVVIGGLVTSTLLTLAVLPALFAAVTAASGRRLPPPP